MATTILHAASGALTGSLVTLYTAPASERFVFKAMTVANSTGAAVSLIVEITATSGGTARQVIPARTVIDVSTDLCAEVINQVLDPAGIIQASGNGMVYMISGILISV